MSQKVISLVSFVSLFLLLIAVPAWALVRIDPFNTISADQEEVLRGASHTPTPDQTDSEVEETHHLSIPIIE